ncbi:MAG: lipoate--protein ligase [Candidatus Ranarchaeia archaeon]
MILKRCLKISEKKPWRVVDLGYQEPYAANTIYETVAKWVSEGKSPNTLIFLNPKDPYVCIGLHQDADKELDIEYVEEKKYPIIRRTQGGGSVFLDSGQLFYQYILKTSDVPADSSQLFKTLIEPVVDALNELKIPAVFKPLNDILVSGKKISGNGAGVLGEATILVGNVILDINTKEMARVLKTPNEKFRDKLAENISQWVTSLKKEFATPPSRELIIKTIIKSVEKRLGIKLESKGISQEEMDDWENTTKPTHQSKEWVFQPGASREKILRKIKIHGNLKLAEVSHKATKLVRVLATLKNNKIEDIAISGDFFVTPIETISKLEEKLMGVEINKEKISKIVNNIFSEKNVNSYGIPSIDFIDAISKLE